MDGVVWVLAVKVSFQVLRPTIWLCVALHIFLFSIFGVWMLCLHVCLCTCVCLKKAHHLGPPGTGFPDSCETVSECCGLNQALWKSIGTFFFFTTDSSLQLHLEIICTREERLSLLWGHHSIHWVLDWRKRKTRDCLLNTRIHLSPLSVCGCVCQLPHTPALMARTGFNTIFHDGE